jgi:hypothetical protein
MPRKQSTKTRNPRKPLVGTAPSTKVILVLPCEGSPFIWKNKCYTTKDKEGVMELTEQLSKAVGGDVERGDISMLRIHPSFGNRWSIASTLCQKKDVNMYLNENGMNACSPNMACLCLERDVPCGKPFSAAEYLAAPLRVRRAPFFGNVALVMPLKTLAEEIDPLAMKLVRVEDYYKDFGWKEPTSPSDEADYDSELGGYVCEPFHDEDMKKALEVIKEKGWFLGSFGQVFMKPTGRDDEKRNTEYDSDSEEEEEEEDDGFEDCDFCGYTHHYEDKCPKGSQCEKYEKWREDEKEEDEDD